MRFMIHSCRKTKLKKFLWGKKNNLKILSVIFKYSNIKNRIKWEKKNSVVHKKAAEL